jgi:hypothetical protein
MLLKYKEIFKADKERGESLNNIIQFYIDRFNDSVKISEKQVETDVVLSSLENIRTLYNLQRETVNKDLEITYFIENCLRLLEDRIEKLRPDIFLKSFENF